MAFKKFIPITATVYKEYVSLTKSGILFSSQFMDNNKLLKKQSVYFYKDDQDPYSFGCEFFDDRDEGHFAIIRTGRNPRTTNRTAMTGGHSFINATPILYKIAKGKNSRRSESRFEIRYDNKEKLYVFKVQPSFENSSDLAGIPEIKGIYRYLDNKNRIIYIGQGNIKQQAKQDYRKNWQIKKIEYSEVTDADFRKNLETYYLDTFEEENGRLTKYNLVSGRTIK